VDRFEGATATLSWTPGPEKGITGYIDAYGWGERARQIRVTAPRVTLSGVREGDAIAVKAVNAKGLEGWDWARVVAASGGKKGTARTESK
jgi:hypothetical protein